MVPLKNFLIILIATIAVSLVIILNPFSEDESDFSHFTFDAVYIKDQNSIIITFSDTTGKSSFAILEILGMETTYHKGKTTPVTLEITYDGNVVKMKTEVHEKDEPKPEIIFSTSSQV